jgi:hypoxanthine phosphoribosyltransferase/uncharacterized HAD superfamily protein
MIIKNINDLNNEVVKNLDKIKKLNIDIIVGIPRSGMIPASLLSTYLQLPMTDPLNLLVGKFYYKSGEVHSIETKKTILLVDDTIDSGKSMQAAVNQLSKLGHNIIRFAVWRSNNTSNTSIDCFCSTLNQPRAFSWNLWAHKGLSSWATDLDGVLCKDPTAEENDRGERYINFIKTATPLFPLKRKIKYIITGRLEKYRKDTENWLYKNNIKYDQLIMKKDDSIKHSKNKIEILKKLPDVKLYIESEYKQARDISAGTEIPVWCIETQQFFSGKV